MLQKFVILKAMSGKPLKRVFITSEDNEIIIGDPERLAEIKSGDHGIACVSYERVFNFEEDAYLELVREWEASKATSSAAWMRLGHIDLPNEADDNSCPFWC
jgi:hypothetical protein